MPLIFVHGVATRPSNEYDAMVAQRDQLFRLLTFQDKDLTIFNPMWGSFGVQFGDDLPWLPKPSGNQAFGINGASGAAAGSNSLDSTLPLGKIASKDAEQAVDLIAMAALDQAIQKAAKLALLNAATRGDGMQLAQAAAKYLERKQVFEKDERTSFPALAANNNEEFAQALEVELKPDSAVQAFGIGDTIRSALGHLAGIVGNASSDALLRAFRRNLSRGASLFMGDVFVYLRGREVAGPDGTRERIFKPVIESLIAASKAPRKPNEPFVVARSALSISSNKNTAIPRPLSSARYFSPALPHIICRLNGFRT
jgi:hypothetical protein